MNERDALDRVRPLIRTRQVREFEPEPVSEAELHAITEAARWTGSSQNSQPWRFVVVRDRTSLERLAAAGQPQTRPLQTAAAAVAIVLPADSAREPAAYDEGRAAERILIAAGMLGLGAGITWVRRDVQADARAILGLPDDTLVRTVVALGHPTAEARRPKSPPGQARLPRESVVYDAGWRRG